MSGNSPGLGIALLTIGKVRTPNFCICMHIYCFVVKIHNCYQSIFQAIYEPHDNFIKYNGFVNAVVAQARCIYLHKNMTRISFKPRFKRRTTNAYFNCQWYSHRLIEHITELSYGHTYHIVTFSINGVLCAFNLNSI